MQTQRTCRTCGAAKPVDDFYRQPARIDGRETECKTCHKARSLRNKRATARRRDRRRAKIAAALDLYGLKVCRRCRETKLRDHDFHIDRQRADGRYAYCKPCQRASVRASTAKHGRNTYESQHRVAARAYVAERKAQPCADCGRSWPAKVMHYHHLDPAKKSASIALLISRGAPVPVIEAEIAKCVLLCGNCHVLRHLKED